MHPRGLACLICTWIIATGSVFLLVKQFFDKEQQRHRHERIANEIARLGGDSWFDSDHLIAAIDFKDIDLTNVDLATLIPVSVRSVNLEGSHFVPSEFAKLGPTPHLKRVDLSRTAVSRSVIRSLKHRMLVRSIDLDGCRLDEGAIDELMDMPQLQPVSIDFSLMTHESIDRLSSQTQFRVLNRPTSDADVCLAFNHLEVNGIRVLHSRDGVSVNFTRKSVINNDVLKWLTKLSSDSVLLDFHGVPPGILGRLGELNCDLTVSFLTTIGVHDWNISEFEALQAARVVELWLSGGRLSEQHLSAIASMQSLKKLRIISHNFEFGGRLLQELAGSKSLESITLVAPATVGIVELAKTESLNELSIYGHCSKRELQALRASRPDLKIKHRKR